MTSQSNDEKSEPARQFSGLVPICDIAIGAYLVFLLPTRGLAVSASDTLAFRQLNFAFLAFHLLVLGGYCRSTVLAAIQGRGSWNTVLSSAVILTSVTFVSLSAIFSWFRLAHPDSLALVTSVSTFLTLFEFLWLVVYIRDYTARQIQGYAAAGNYQAALKLLKPQLLNKTVNWWDLVSAGIFHLRLGEIEEGQRLVEQGLVLSGRDPVALTHGANARYIEQRYAEGLALTDEVIAKIGEQPILLLNRCTFLVELDRVSEARSIWRQLKDPAKLVPKNDRDGQRVFSRLCTLLNEPDATGAAT